MTLRVSELTADFALGDRYTVESGTIYLNGIQALVRILLDQKRADTRAGLKTGGFICGYPGSPVGGVDAELSKQSAMLDAHNIVHRFGLNEELAATAVFGSQALHAIPAPQFDGVFGMWFGKAPGVDRAVDAFRHANFRGVGRNGGVLAVAGDDPHARSTIFPSDSNLIFQSLYMPTLCPGCVQEVIDFGLHGYALSRASGLMVGFKLVTDVADSTGTALVDPSRIAPVIPQVMFDGVPLVPSLRINEAGAPLVEAERRIVHGQLEIARRYATLNGLNSIMVAPKRARLGILTVGKTYFDVRQALSNLGFDDVALHERGIRILKMGMIFPVESDIIRSFAEGLDEIVVIEDKRATLESAVKDILYGSDHRPRIFGKHDENGRPLLPSHGELSADDITLALAPRLRPLVDDASRIDARVDHLTRKSNSAATVTLARQPYFCSGCPHNRSLRVPENAVVGAGIGCHIMTLWAGDTGGQVVGFTQMGGEGAQWVGLAPFSGTKHFFQNLGDGTFAHSGSLAIRFAVSAGINVTYKILYNSTVAMTGGQDVAGGMSVPDMVKMLFAEGVRRILITTDEPEQYRGLDVQKAQVMHRDRLIEIETMLAAEPGVTVLINDQQCAAEKRRKRKRGTLATKSTTVVINERICEGCGDCGAKSNCLSVQPIETEFGRKTHIHQSSCNQDYSCLLGDCPSFMTIETAQPLEKKPRALPQFPPDVSLPAPVVTVDASDYNAGLVGIGGTGVVTVNQILGVAAHLAGLHAKTYDHTGSSQKAGPVVSHLKLSTAPIDAAPTLSKGAADLYLVFDVLGAINPVNLAMVSPERTVAVVSTTRVATGEMVADVVKAFPSMDLITTRLNAATHADANVFVDAQTIAEKLTGDHMASNLFMVGLALQKGLIPIPVAHVERAIHLNGSAVKQNMQALAWGRYFALDSAAVEKLANSTIAPATITAPAPHPEAVAMAAALNAPKPLRALLTRRASELIAYQNTRYASDYVALVGEVMQRDAAVKGQVGALSEAVARNLYKLMAYKDEYEVARLMCLQPSLPTAKGSKRYWHIHPTFLRSLGIRKKIRLGAWFTPAIVLLAAMKRVRHTPFDLFGVAHMRRIERALIVHYRKLVALIVGDLTEANYDRSVAILELPDMIRGYENVKSENLARYAERLTVLTGGHDRQADILSSIYQAVSPHAPRSY